MIGKYNTKKTFIQIDKTFTKIDKIKKGYNPRRLTAAPPSKEAGLKTLCGYPGSGFDRRFHMKAAFLSILPKAIFF